MSGDPRWEAVVDLAVDGILVIDEGGRIESFNRAAEDIFGYGADEIVGRNVSVLMPEPHRTGHDGYLDRYLETGEAGIIGVGREVQGIRKDGSAVPLYLGVSEVEIGGSRRFAGIVRDLTQGKAAEAELREAREHLERPGRGANGGARPAGAGAAGRHGPRPRPDLLRGPGPAVRLRQRAVPGLVRPRGPARPGGAWSGT